MQIGIVGYGTAGQTLALLLAHDGRRVQVFERAPQQVPASCCNRAGYRCCGGLVYSSRCWSTARQCGGCMATPGGRAVYRDLDTHLFGLGMPCGALFALLAQVWDGDAALARHAYRGDR